MTEKIEIVFLGTGSAVPTVRKNHPGILLKYKDESMLFDCGEGIQRQFRIAKENPCRLTRLFISHWHGDHVLGIPGILQTLAMNNYGKTLEVYGPFGTKKFMEKILGLFVSLEKINIKIKEVKEGKILESDDFFVEAFEMEHNTNCLAYNFVEKDKVRIDKKKLAKFVDGNNRKIGELKKGKNVMIDGKKVNFKDVSFIEEGRKVSVVMDTRQNKNILKAAKDSDLLISEATFLGNEELAKEYFHLTVEQAANNAKNAKAKKLFLIHLSQRHESDDKAVLKVAKDIFKNSEIAKDFMKIVL